MAGFEIFTDTQQVIVETDLPLFKEIAIDFKSGEPILQDKKIIILEKTDALKVWVWKTLKTERDRYLIYSRDYGNDLIENIGQIYDKKTKDALMINEIKDCLLVNPYITNVYNFSINGGRSPVISFNVDTIYGIVESEVNTELWNI